MIGTPLNSFGCGLTIHNLDQTEGVDQVNWNINLYDVSGAKVGGTYRYMYALFPDETRGADSCGGQTQPPNATIARMEVTASACGTCWEPIRTKERRSVNATLDRSNATI